MRDGWTLTRELLTYDDRVPDAYDIAADEVDPREKWVLRRYDEIVQAFDVVMYGTGPGDLLRRNLTEQGTIPDPEFDWFDFTLYADMLNAATQQEEAMLAYSVAGPRRTPVWLRFA